MTDAGDIVATPGLIHPRLTDQMTGLRRDSLVQIVNVSHAQLRMIVNFKRMEKIEKGTGMRFRVFQNLRVSRHGKNCNAWANVPFAEED